MRDTEHEEERDETLVLVHLREDIQEGELREELQEQELRQVPRRWYIY